MKNYAFILLSSTIFGGAQRRFIHLFLYLKKQHPNLGVFIMTDAMAKELRSQYGEEAMKGVVSIGPKRSFTQGQRTSTVKEGDRKKSAIITIAKKTIVYKLYYFLKNRKSQKLLFREIDSIVKEKQIEAFVAIYTGVFPLYFYLNKKRKRPGIIFVNMDSWFSHLSDNPRRDWFRQYDLFHRAHLESDKLDLLSPFIQDGLRKRKVFPDPKKINITACSFTDYSRCHSNKKEKLDVMFASRLEADKNPMMFVEAAAKVAPLFPQSQFLIAGDGRLANAVKEKIKTLKIPNIHYLGYIPHITEVLSETSLFVSLQKDNNYPSQSVLEAMACENAIIATDVGDTKMFIDENNGWLIEAATETLVKQLRYCLEHPEETIAKGKYASSFCRNHFTIEKAAEYYLNLINSVNPA